jgi:hypothetical protein
MINDIASELANILPNPKDIRTADLIFEQKGIYIHSINVIINKRVAKATL